MEKICRLNYIGSKFQLLDWLTSTIIEKAGEIENKTFVDLFAGTGVVSHHFRKLGANVISNDVELYSSIICHAFTCSIYTAKCQEILHTLQSELDHSMHTETTGLITSLYSPEGDRQFFTVENARRIDYIRKRIEELKSDISTDEYMFILASLLVSADMVSNVPAVYGCYLKTFKQKALKELTLTPIHQCVIPTESIAYNYDVLNPELHEKINADIVYLDPPYNERQYSKNYFPLNIIAKLPESQVNVKGKTGIPDDCFVSPFCKKKQVEQAFDTLIKSLNTTWVFMSYNSESLISKEKMITLLSKYGDVSVKEKEYKRFKSFEYNEDIQIYEYLFCLRKFNNP